MRTRSHRERERQSAQADMRNVEASVEKMIKTLEAEEREAQRRLQVRAPSLCTVPYSCTAMASAARGASPKRRSRPTHGPVQGVPHL